MTEPEPQQQPEPETATPPPTDPSTLFASPSLAAIEAEMDALMNDRMGQLDGMLAGLEELVVRLEGEITELGIPMIDDESTP